MLSLVCSRCGSGGGDLFQRRLPDGTQDVCLCMACSNKSAVPLKGPPIRDCGVPLVIVPKDA